MKLRVQRKAAVCQGDLFRNVDLIESVQEVGNQLVVSRIRFPLVVVLTQDCDLEQDYAVRWGRRRPAANQDKLILSVLVSPLYNAEHVIAGEHLSELGQEMERISRSKKWNHVRNNEIPRYHYLEFPEDVPIANSVIDFKHYFSVSISELKKKKQRDFVGKIAELFREDISHRFASYLSRIGLP